MYMVTVANEAFQKFLQQFIDDRLENAHTFVQYLPVLVSRYGYEEIPPLSRNESDKIRIGIIGNHYHLSDLLLLKEARFLLTKTLKVF